MVEYGSGLAEKNNLANLEYRKGDLEHLPIDDACVEWRSLLNRCITRTSRGGLWRKHFRILKPGGRAADWICSDTIFDSGA